jgi:hypothetical protein
MRKDIQNKLIQAMQEWASSVQDEPCFSILDSPMMTPKEIVNSIKNETVEGKAYMEILDHAVRVEGMYRVINRFKLKCDT